MSQLLDLSFSDHGFLAGIEFFNVYEFVGLVNFSVSGALSQGVLFEAGVQVFGVTSIATAVFAQNDVNVVWHRISHTFIIGILQKRFAHVQGSQIPSNFLT